jgi:hypothetical protein
MSSDVDSDSERNLTINSNMQENRRLNTSPPIPVNTTPPARSPLASRKFLADNVKGKNVKESASCSANVHSLRRSSRNIKKN